MTGQEGHKVPLLRWKSIMATDAFHQQSPTKEKPAIKRTITSEEAGTLKDSQTLARDIAIESSKFYRAMVSDGELFAKNQGPMQLRPRGSVPIIPSLNASLEGLAYCDPAEYCESIESNHMKAHTPRKPPQPFIRRNSSVTNELVRRFDYNDPELELKVSHHGIVVMGGTKEKLMDLLTDLGFMEIQYITEFLGVYPYFATPLELLKDLMITYFEPAAPVNLDTKYRNQFVQRTRKRIHFILRRWIENYPSEFWDSSQATDQLQFFISQLEDNMCKESLQSLVNSKILIHKAKFDFLTPRIVPEKSTSPLFMKSVDVLAKQLCLMDQSLLCKIESHEFKGQKWTKKDAFNHTPNITRCIEFFNRLSYWCATEILTRKSSSDRLKVLKRLICLAKRCAVHHNYNSAFAITSALNFSSVSRLKKTWKALSGKYTAIYREMEEMCKVEANYFPYKKLLLSQTPPLVPYLGVFLRDLTFLEVGNPSYLDEEQKMINYDKFRMIASVLLDFQKYQQVLYPFAPHKQIQTALRYSLVTLDENELFELSYEIEPRRN
uniref:Ras-GEF domain-containing protein n=1 Tax=Vannella robusta TaxID=1487602 RepID=A0A6U1WWX8_9EUKA|mmetsp:Transcript_5580/g.6861  ORF Transcript_5580/g.6861 Transcript_5580/m.6861 type:complete len:550 (+) Transcript_5580:63-1712(+)